MTKTFVFSVFLYCVSLSNFARASSYYDEIVSFLENNPEALKECQCVKGLKRTCDDLKVSLRGKLDRKATEFLLSHGNIQDSKPVLFFFGSGKLLNEVTIISSLMSKGLSPSVYLIDNEYAFKKRSDMDEKIFKNYASIIEKQEAKYSVKVRTYIFESFIEAFKAFLKTSERITAFFCTDVYYPTSNAQALIRAHLEYAISLSEQASFSSQLLFFFLTVAKAKSDTESSSPSGAALDIYEGQILNGELEYQQLLYHREQ